jgi:hypothetical protein
MVVTRTGVPRPHISFTNVDACGPRVKLPFDDLHQGLRVLKEGKVECSGAVPRLRLWIKTSLSFPAKAHSSADRNPLKFN